MSDATRTDAYESELRGWPTEPVLEESGDGSSAEAGAFADVELDADGMPTEEAIREALRAVLDPEIGINIVALGLLYYIEKSHTDDGSAKVDVTMTLTTMGCPLTELMHQQCTLLLTRLPGVDEVDVHFTFSPPWSTAMIEDDAKTELQAMGFSV